MLDKYPNESHSTDYNKFRKILHRKAV